jgi:hypothetical protein
MVDSDGEESGGSYPFSLLQVRFSKFVADGVLSSNDVG